MSTLTGTTRLFRLALRRDRVLLPIWLLSLSVLTAAVVSSVTALYGSAQERAEAAAFSAGNVAARIFDGPASGTETGAMAMVEAYAILAILVALMSTQAVVRHTRQDEETGRAELIGSTVVGRHARLAAALLTALSANLVLAGVVAVTLMSYDLAWPGAVASGAAVAGVGVTFAGVAAVTAQLSASQRGANGLAVIVLGLAYLLRAVGDAVGEVAPSGVALISAWPSWLSPIGWGQQVRPFHQDNWDVLGLFAGAFGVLVALGFWLTDHRDVGAGMFAVRRGPATAPAGLLRPLGLVWRLQRATLLAWVVGLVILGAAFGAVGESVDDMVGISDRLEELIRQQAGGAGLVDLYFAFMMGFLAIAVAAYTVQALLRMRSEEANGHLEPVLATAVGRGRWLCGHLLVAAAGTLAVLLATGVSGAVGYALAVGDVDTALGMVRAALAQAPAVLALGGLVVAVFGWLPRWTFPVAWGALAVSLVMGQLGEVLELPQPVLNLSPFTHVGPVPAEPVGLAPTAILLASAVMLAGAGIAGFRRRDLAISA